ncbi:MAG: hypothetical protein EZS28_011009 [Streblomastix strix]|uniref:Uncharacterized protein n=1 Tax=Streblomastix strix TaxID=222440 RepID=A0A5J4WFR4_9EUKA|nr:MAG: hypothetical protein EZS28_011009 [Streblomastix strix]
MKSFLARLVLEGVLIGSRLSMCQRMRLSIGLVNPLGSLSHIEHKQYIGQFPYSKISNLVDHLFEYIAKDYQLLVQRALPFGTFLLDPLLAYRVFHLKNLESNDNKYQDDGRTLLIFEYSSNPSYSVVYFALNRNSFERSRNQSIFNRLRDTNAEYQKLNITAGYTSNELVARCQRGR